MRVLVYTQLSWEWISQYQTRATVEIFFTRLRLVKNISTVALVWYCEIHSHDSCVYTITPFYYLYHTEKIVWYFHTHSQIVWYGYRECGTRVSFRHIVWYESVVRRKKSIFMKNNEKICDKNL